MRNIPMIRETLATHHRAQMLDITKLLQQQVSEAGLINGMIVVYCPHTTAAVTINENADPDVKHDLLEKLGTLIPQRESYYDHAEGNSDAHVKTAMVGNSATVLVESGRMMLGRWQGVYFCEFDGPRERQVWIKLVGFEAGQ